jgi:hypothetical protein
MALQSEVVTVVELNVRALTLEKEAELRRIVFNGGVMFAALSLNDSDAVTS